MIPYEIAIRIEELENLKKYLDHEIIDSRIEFLEQLKKNKTCENFQYPKTGWVD